MPSKASLLFLINYNLLKGRLERIGKGLETDEAIAKTATAVVPKVQKDQVLLSTAFRRARE